MKHFTIKNWNKGIAESDYLGIGDLRYSVGTDVSIEGKIQVNQKLTKKSSTTVTDFCKYGFAASDGKTYWFGDTGKIYRESSDTFTKVGDMTEEIFGACEYNGYLYWATATTEYKVIISSTDFDADKTTVGTFTNGDTPHPHIVHLTNLYIGDGKDIVKSTDVTSSVLDLDPDMIIQTINSYGIDLMIGSRVSNTNQCQMVRWNCNDPSWNFGDAILEDSINSVVIENQTNEILVSAGSKGNLYSYTGSALKFVRQIPGIYTPTAKSAIYSMANFGNSILIGVSNLTGNPCLQGVYRYWSIPDYKCLNLDYVISPDKTASISVGAIVVQGQDVWVAWKDGDTYGIDKLDYSNKYSGAYFETITYRPNRSIVKLLKEVRVATEKLPASCSVDVEQKADEASSWSDVGEINTENTTLKTLSQKAEHEKIKFKVTLNTSSNTTPAIEELDIGLDLLNKIK